jgi:2-dehydro-3-deoxyglucarate aldolase/4-hydroxy-2-oxoheptanedioate aldolase
MTLFKKKLMQRELLVGTMLSEVYHANVARVLQTGGVQFLIVDNEHGFFDYALLSNIIAVCNGFDLPVFVRISSINRDTITKTMDMGADGLVVPMVNRAVQAKEVVQYAKYAPLGNRGVSLTRAHSNYHVNDLSEYIATANERTVILAQIETREALENVDEIASVEGLDGLVVGPNDLSMDLGCPGVVRHEQVLQAAATVAAAAERANKASGIITTDTELIRICSQQGMTLFSCNSEVGLLLKATKQMVNQVRENIKV